MLEHVQKAHQVLVVPDYKVDGGLVKENERDALPCVEHSLAGQKVLSSNRYHRLHFFHIHTFCINRIHSDKLLAIAVFQVYTLVYLILDVSLDRKIVNLRLINFTIFARIQLDV